uniref:MGMT family protein n=1 Tax=Veillonella magna TaxID=464322 RepID=UPI00402A8510
MLPCPRVIGDDGALTGYTGGLDIKIRLLKLEHLTVTDNHVISPTLISTASSKAET